MNTQISLDYLRRQQAPDGSFAGLASPTLKPFVPRRQQPTIFPTILILDSLHDVVGAEDIRLRAATYLESQVSAQGSWNYWSSGSAAKVKEPYPDDLDDTALALAALMRADTKWVDGRRLGQFARLLVAAEQQPGGPYNTWLIDTVKAPQWRHIDPAVNANIGYALSLQAVKLGGLADYFDKLIATGVYKSDYYVGEAPVLYFLSRWYQGDQLPALRTKVGQVIESRSSKTALEQALLLTAGCRVEIPQQQLAALANDLQRGARQNYWPAAPLYVDPIYNQQQHFGGSAALTTALALEALTAYAKRTLSPSVVIARKRGVPQLMSAVRQDAEAIANVHLRRRYLAAARQQMQDVAGEQISAPATLMMQAGGWKVPAAILTNLNLASLNGWMAYTLYDDFLDGATGSAQLNVANVALRRSYGYFMETMAGQTDFIDYCKKAFDTIDSANDWEQQYARAQVEAGVISLNRLPDYQDYQQLADRSWGHSLAVTAVARLHYGSLDHPRVQALQTFFKHFLIARQLNDDAHDWIDDLQAGQLSAVVTLLLADQYQMPQRLVLADELDGLRQHYWQQTIDQVAKIILHHAAAAQQALDELEADIKTTIFRRWLDALEASVAAAMKGRQEALKFMQAYEGSHV